MLPLKSRPIYFVNKSNIGIIIFSFVSLYDDLKVFFKEEFAKMLKRTNIREEIECKLPYGEENRVDYIIEMFKELS